MLYFNQIKEYKPLMENKNMKNLNQIRKEIREKRRAESNLILLYDVSFKTKALRLSLQSQGHLERFTDFALRITEKQFERL